MVERSLIATLPDHRRHRDPLLALGNSARRYLEPFFKIVDSHQYLILQLERMTPLRLQAPGTLRGCGVVSARLGGDERPVYPEDGGGTIPWCVAQI